VETLGMKEKHSFNRKNQKPRRERAIGGVEIYIELSQESSPWAKIPNPDIVRLGRTLSSQIRLCPIRDFCERF
jgi:hypothetical protein